MKTFIKAFSGYVTIIFTCILILTTASFYSYADPPVITVRFANPEIDCDLETYSVDVEFQSNTANTVLFDMNVRFFFDAELLTFQSFFGFEPGYSAITPNPPNINYLSPGSGNTLFGFFGEGVIVNGAIQRTNGGATPIYISTSGWTKLFRMRFGIQDLTSTSLTNICPSLVWDLKQNPSQGSFIPGSDGVVMTTVNPIPGQPSLPVTENVVQFNWVYNQDPGLPHGWPALTDCIPNPCNNGHVVILPGQAECFESDGAITVGGNPPAFIVEPNGSAFLVSPVSITLLPGTHVKTGGYLRAWISDEGCVQPASMLASADEEYSKASIEIPVIAEDKLFRVFPNPTLGIFHLEMLQVCEASTAIAEIYSASGTRITQRALDGNPLHQFNISNMPRGIYIIRVICNDRIEVERVIRN